MAKICSSMNTLTIPHKNLNVSENPIKPSSFPPKTHFSIPSKTPNLSYLLKIGRLNEALTALDSITAKGYKLKSQTFTQLLDYCINCNSPEFGRQLHARIIAVEGFNPFVETKLVGMYAKCGCLSDARKVFDKMSERNLFSFSAMIGAYCRDENWGEVIHLFGLMMQEGILPDGLLFPKILQACANCGDVLIGEVIHSLVIRSGLRSGAWVTNSLLGMYAKSGQVSLASKFFKEMDHRDIVSWNSLITGFCSVGENGKAVNLLNIMYDEGIKPNLITWNIVISGYNQCGDYDTALELVNKMKRLGMVPDLFTWTSLISGLAQNNRVIEALDLFTEMLLVNVQPNEVTLASVLSACASVRAIEQGKEIHSIAAKMGLCDNVLVGNALIDMYSKCEELEAARKIFDMMSEKDLYTWNSMIAGYCQGGYCGKAHDLFLSMQESKTSPSAVTWNVIISGYFQNGLEDQAMELFEMMGKDGIVKPNTSSWNSLISGFLQIGCKDKALKVFRKMQSLRYRPNPVTILSILPACGNLIASNKVKEIHACVLHGNLDAHVAILNSLIDIYGKSGNLEYSKAVFNCISSKDIISWNSIIAAYVLHGRPMDALDYYVQMMREGHKPNRGTFVSLILACGRAKMVEKGKQLFDSMTNDYQIMPSSEHYAAMVYLFGSSGRLKEAMKFINYMEVEPDSAVWDALLTASRSLGSVALTIHAGEHLLELNPGDGVVHHLVSQAYKACGRYVDTLKKYRGIGLIEVKKPSGCSLLELNHKVYQFISGDFSAPGLNTLSAWLKSFAGNIKLPDSNSLYCLHEEDSDEICGLHSEKLALAFALYSTQSKIKCIRIVKNFRICEDSHRTAKYISSAFGCEIFISHTKCLHHFKNGHCSCGDYW